MYKRIFMNSREEFVQNPWNLYRLNSISYCISLKSLIYIDFVRVSVAVIHYTFWQGSEPKYPPPPTYMLKGGGGWGKIEKTHKIWLKYFDRGYKYYHPQLKWKHEINYFTTCASMKPGHSGCRHTLTRFGGGHVQRLVGVRRVGGSGRLSHPAAGEVFKNFGKNQWKSYNFRVIIPNFNEYFVINALNFSGKFGKYSVVNIYSRFGGNYCRQHEPSTQTEENLNFILSFLH